MGPPVKVDVQGTQVWICCDDCREQLLAEPEQYLAKLRAE
jgi:Cu(I)/Ag(I) efflux system membrane fusion protein